jgi:hypothetical protein
MTLELAPVIIKCAACGGVPYSIIVDVYFCKACYRIVMECRLESEPRSIRTGTKTRALREIREKEGVTA